MESDPLAVRWLGRVTYDDALRLQRSLHETSRHNYVLLLEHPNTFTLGRNADPAHVLFDIANPPTHYGSVTWVDRGGDVTFHGPGQLVAYPLLSLTEPESGKLPSTRAYVSMLEAILVDTCRRLGIEHVGVIDDYPGVCVNPNGAMPKKIAAIGVKIERGRTMHGIALNVNPDLDMFNAIVPCGISTMGVTSLHEQGADVAMIDVVNIVTESFVQHTGAIAVERQDVAHRIDRLDRDLSAFSRGDGAGPVISYAQQRGSHAETVSRSVSEPPGTIATDPTPVRLLTRMRDADVDSGKPILERKPAWMRAKLDLNNNVMSLRSTLEDNNIVTVCQEAGCPNLSECWNDGTATFMLCGSRCTRKCGFCLVDTSKPEPLDPTEPMNVANATAEMNLDYVVLTMVARDDLVDGGAQHVAHTIEAIRARAQQRGRTITIEALISDFAGTIESLDSVLDSGVDVLNHNLETVPRLQRVVRPSASYARSLSVLAHSKKRGFVTKTGIIAGMGETSAEIEATLFDAANIGVDIVTIGQYLRPTTHHLPVNHWWEPDQFDAWKRIGESFGIRHVESSPLTRSSYHAKQSFSSNESTTSTSTI